LNFELFEGEMQRTQRKAHSLKKIPEKTQTTFPFDLSHGAAGPAGLFYN
jgi:hypothetical protein